MAEEFKSSAGAALIKEEHGEDYTTEIQSLACVLLSMCKLEDTTSCLESEQSLSISGMYSPKLKKHIN